MHWALLWFFSLYLLLYVVINDRSFDKCRTDVTMPKTLSTVKFGRCVIMVRRYFFLIWSGILGPLWLNKNASCSILDGSICTLCQFYGVNHVTSRMTTLAVIFPGPLWIVMVIIWLIEWTSLPRPEPNQKPPGQVESPKGEGEPSKVS